MIEKLIKKLIIINSLPYSELIKKANKPEGVKPEIIKLELFRAEIDKVYNELTGRKENINNSLDNETRELFNFLNKHGLTLES